MAVKILLVGGGITSAAAGMCIRKALPDSQLFMWDKARGIGGRMTTSRYNLEPSCTGDLGAQYITTTEPVMKLNSDIYDHLFSKGILEPLQCQVIGMKPQGNRKSFVVPNGIGFVVEELFKMGDLDGIRFSHHVSSLVGQESKWVVETKTGEKDSFDIVILTMPVPQLFLLEGSVMDNLKPEADLTRNLQTVKYSSRYVLILFFVENISVDWGFQYLENDPIFRYAAVDNFKRNRSDLPCAVVLHTTVDFGLHRVEDSIPDVEIELLSHVKKLFPQWPTPKGVKCHKWRYSQVSTTFPGEPGCVVISENPGLIIGGDGFVGSTFDNCVASAKIICNEVKRLVI